MKTTTTRALRESLSATMEAVAGGEEIVVTRRGKPYVRMLPASTKAAHRAYPLRGSVLRMSDDFDEPSTDAWSALR
jgi:prevent-host-death family protein